jgi:hypothetical protein
MTAAARAARCVLAAAAAVLPLARPPAARAQTRDDATASQSAEYRGNEKAPGYGAAAPDLYHYDLYLPPGYSDAPARRYPCLFVMSPGGGAKLGPFAARVRRDRWIAVMLVDARNGPVGPIFGNFLAAHDDVVRRWRVAEGLKVATGFSGGSTGAAAFVTLRRGFGGLLLQGAGAHLDPKGVAGLPVFAAFGTGDPNLEGLASLRAQMPDLGYLLLDGGHAALPAARVDEVFDWFEGRWVADSSRALPPEFAVEIFRRRLAALGAGGPPTRRHDDARVVAALIARLGLRQRPDFEADVAAADAALKALGEDAALRAEVDARTAFEAARDIELYARAAQRGRRAEVRPLYAPRSPEDAARAYRAVAARWPDAEYGRRAAARAGPMEKGP